MTQSLLRPPATRPFVDAKTAVQDALRLGFDTYRAYGVIDYKVDITKGDPLKPANIPAISVNRVSDGEINRAMGDFFAEERDPEMDATIKKLGTDFRETIEIRIWTTNSDQRDLLYGLSKAILFEYRHYLALKYGLVNQNIVGGRDEANHVQYDGHAMYFGVIMFQTENSIQRNIIVPSVTEIRSEIVLQSDAPNTDDV